MIDANDFVFQEGSISPPPPAPPPRDASINVMDDEVIFVVSKLTVDFRLQQWILIKFIRHLSSSESCLFRLSMFYGRKGAVEFEFYRSSKL